MCDLRVESSRTCTSALQGPEPSATGAWVSSFCQSHCSATRTDSPRRLQRLLVASRILGDGGLGARPNCAVQRWLGHLRDGRSPAVLRHLPLEAGLFLRVPACLPRGSEPGKNSEPGVTGATAPRPPSSLSHPGYMGPEKGGTRGCPPVATLTALPTSQAHILPLWARAGSGAHPA